MKKIATYIIIFALSALSVAGAAVVLHVQSMQQDFVKNITVVENGMVEDKLEMVAHGLNPGTEKVFTVNLGCAEGMEGDYQVTIDFAETDESPLKQFVDVEITLNGEAVYTGKLSDLLKEETQQIAFRTDLSVKSPSKIVFRYSVDESIGNEAMQKNAYFDICITAKK